MGLNVAIQMDWPARLNRAGDSTYILGLEAQKRGHQLFFYHPS
ncbi:MAG: glutathione synthase, partial [Anaerolineae bacterium]|nr:glutathione synthase [Anaerolineae bacterium]